jgi:hypothetical protein
MKARVSPPLRMDQPNFSLVTNRMNPKRPKMIEGMPARQSAPKRMIRVTRLSQVYSVR